MVATWTLNQVIRYFCDAAKNHPGLVGRRRPLQFTDKVPETEEWTYERLRRLNRTLRVIINGPFDWEATEYIIQHYIMVRRARGFCRHSA